MATGKINWITIKETITALMVHMLQNETCGTHKEHEGECPASI